MLTDGNVIGKRKEKKKEGDRENEETLHKRGVQNSQFLRKE